MSALTSEFRKWVLLIGKSIILAIFSVLLSPIALAASIWHLLRGGADVTPLELAEILRDVSEGRHPAWDDLECVDLRNTQLEAIRQEALKVSEPLTLEGRSKLLRLADQAEALSGTEE